MTDFIDHVERELRAAVRRHDHLPWYVRWRMRHSRALVVVLAGLIVAGPALAAVGLLRTGSSVGPVVPPTPTALDGVAIPASIRLLSLRVADPGGGIPWGMRLIRTTRGVLCVQVGRVAFGTVGALGRDDAFANDGRFHPFSPNYEQGPSCVTPDAHGNGFVNVAEYGVPASGLLAAATGSGCRARQAPPRQLPAALRRAIELRRRRAGAARAQPRLCPSADVRQIDYGLLGPDAVSITYQASNGRLVTTPTSGQDGAYLVVVRDHANSQNGFEAGDSVFADGIRSVSYRDRPSCRLPAPDVYGAGSVSCPPVGYASPTAPVPTQAQVSAPVNARLVLATSYCANAKTGQVQACPGRTPPGFTRLNMHGGPPQGLVVITFTARVPVTNGHRYYYIQMCNPPDPTRPVPRWFQRLARKSFLCYSGGSGGETNVDYTAGQRVTHSEFIDLNKHGVIPGDVSLVTTTGPSQPGPAPAAPGQSIGRDVGHFSLRVP